MVNRLRKKIVILAISFSLLISPNVISANALGSKFYERTYPVAPGVTYKKENFEINSTRRAINYITADIVHPDLSFQIGFAEPFNKLTRITELAQQHTIFNEKYVVGTINASFYLTNGSGLPANLVVQNNQILHHGRLSETNNDPIFNRYAFGISANGIPMIDSYNDSLSLQVNNQTIPIQTFNAVRRPDQVILFTPSLGYNVPRIDQPVSTEIVVTNASKDTRTLSFGDQITGTVSSVSRHNHGASSVIPEDGFVIAANGQLLMDQLANVQPGDQLTVNLSIDQKWMNSQSMIATGPLLVKDGKPSISMNVKSSFASSRHPRSAVAITRDNKLMLVTVDGRQAGYSDGMSLVDLANYLISLGAVSAINLDGGGSSAIAARIVGHELAYLMNRPSDGPERRVSNAIQIVSKSLPTNVTAPMVVVDKFNGIANWQTTAVRGSSVISPSRSTEPFLSGTRSLKLEYDFVTVPESGTAAAYVDAKQPILLEGKPKKIGMWIYGDGNENWVRAQIIDRHLKSQTLNFTPENNVNTVGWKYVTADIPESYAAPYSVSRIYVVQPRDDRKSKGTLYFDHLEAIYSDSYMPPKVNFSDVKIDFWAFNEINSLIDEKVITGFPDGSFRPGAEVTREQAATMIVRQLKLDVKNRPDPGFVDVDKGGYSYEAIATVAQLGLITGRRAGHFDPKQPMMRAEVALVLKRAYDLKGEGTLSFPDVPQDHWAREAIGFLAESKITTGLPDGTFAPSKNVSRAEFATFLFRASRK